MLSIASLLNTQTAEQKPPKRQKTTHASSRQFPPLLHAVNKENFLPDLQDGASSSSTSIQEQRKRSFEQISTPNSHIPSMFAALVVAVSELRNGDTESSTPINPPLANQKKKSYTRPPDRCLLARKANSQRRARHYKRAAISYDQAINKYLEDEKKIPATLYANAGITQQHLKNHYKAHELFELAINTYLIEEKQVPADLYYNAAKMQRHLNNFTQAAELLTQYFVTCAIEKKAIPAIVYKEASYISLKMKWYKQAAKLYADCISAHQSENKEVPAAVYRNYAYASLMDKDISNSLKYSELALSQLQASPNKPNHALYYYVASAANLLSGNKERDVELYEQAVLMHLKNSVQAAALADIAIIYLESGNISRGLSTMEKVREKYVQEGKTVDDSIEKQFNNALLIPK